MLALVSSAAYRTTRREAATSFPRTARRRNGRFWRLSSGTIVVLVAVAAVNDSSESADTLFRRAFTTYRRKEKTHRSIWDPWNEISTMLLLQVDNPLEIIGAFEESILVIENKATVAAGAGEDPERDAALSKLYFSYAKTLASLGADLCTNDLALSPHNLLIGAETADASQNML
jgi:hypothetical protein